MDQRPAPLSPITPGFTQHLVAHTRFFPMLAVRMDRFHFLQWLIEYTNEYIAII